MIEKSARFLSRARLNKLALLLAMFAGILLVACGESPQNSLLTAATRNDLDRAQRLLSRNDVDVNYRTPVTGQSALEAAAGSSNVEMVRLLLRRGADPNVATSEGMTPTLLAAYHGNADIVRALISAGANVDLAEKRYGYTPLASAAQKGHLEVVEMLVEAGAGIDVRTKDGSAPVDLAERFQKFEVARYLRARMSSGAPAEAGS